jgi:hypothetical protein
MVLLCVLFFIFHIWSRTWIVKKSYEIGDLKKQQTKFESELAAVTVEKNVVMSSQNLEKWVERFRQKDIILQSPRSVQIIYLKKPKNEKDL